MASYIKYSDLCPLKFVNEANNIDYRNEFPSGGNQETSDIFFDNHFPVHYSFPILADNVFKFQFLSDGIINDFVVELLDENKDAISLLGTVTDITPTGWIGDSHFEVSFSITSEGCYYIKMYAQISAVTVQTYISELIEVKYSLDDHVHLRYGNSENDFATIFKDENDTRIQYFYDIFIKGTFNVNPISGVERSAYEDDRMDPQILRSSPKKIYNMYIDYLPGYMISKINMIFGLDEVRVNMLLFATTEGVEFNQLTPNYHGYTGNIQITKQNNDYTQDTNAPDINALIDVEGEFIIDDNGDYIITNE